MHVRLVKSFSFEAAHHLPEFPEGHKCRRMHGHSFKVDVVVEGEIPKGRHYLVDYGDIKKAIDPLQEQLDQRCLKDVAVNIDEWTSIVLDWGASEPCSDLDSSGTVDVADLTEVIEN